MTQEAVFRFDDGNKPATTAKINVTFDYRMIFYNDKGVVGELDFNGPEMIFTGNAEESAKSFMDWLARAFIGRLRGERETCAKLVDHILKEGGGTWGDAIREL